VLAVAAEGISAAVDWVADFIRHHLPHLNSARMTSLLTRFFFMDANYLRYYTSGETYGNEQQAAFRLLFAQVRSVT
jgi:hypothetical protein